MRTIEFKSKVNNQSIPIPKKVQNELKNAQGKAVRVVIIMDEDLASNNYNSVDSSSDVEKDLLDSIDRGLKDFEEGRVHSHKSVRKLYSKFL